MNTVTEIQNRQDPTIPQQAYINDMYNQLDVRYTQRQKPQTIGEASILIDELRRQVLEKADRPDTEDEEEDI